MTVIQFLREVATLITFLAILYVWTVLGPGFLV